MPIERRIIVSALEEKGFRRGNSDHDFYIYYSLAGKKSPVRTKVSRGTSHRDVSDGLVAKMARQCKLSGRDFREFVGCTLTRDTYNRKLGELGLVD